MKLPNGYGSVTKLSGKRRKPYIVRKTIGWKYDAVKDKTIQDYVVIGYAETKKEGLQMLADYNADPYDVKKKRITFAETYDRMMKYHFREKPSDQTLRAYDLAFRKASVLHDVAMADVRREQMQEILDAEKGGRSSKAYIVTLFHQMYSFALVDDICQKDYSQFLRYEAEESERGEPFSFKAINALWDLRDNYHAAICLMMIYSGLRISELKKVDIDIANRTINGGIKTSASKDRLAPIHDGMIDFWLNFDQESFNPKTFRDKKFYPLMRMIGFPFENDKKHTPHDCRHTFSWLADTFGMDETCKHMLMGHSLPGDVEQTVYRHRTFEQLRDAINAIPLPPL